MVSGWSRNVYACDKPVPPTPGSVLLEFPAKRYCYGPYGKMNHVGITRLALLVENVADAFERIQFFRSALVREAFLFSESRVVTKTAMVSLYG